MPPGKERDGNRGERPKSTVARLQARVSATTGGGVMSKSDIGRLVFVAGLGILVLGAMLWLRAFTESLGNEESNKPTKTSDIKLETIPEDNYVFDGYHLKFKDATEEPDPSAKVEANDPRLHYFLDYFRRNYRDPKKVDQLVEADGRKLLERWEAAANRKPANPRKTLVRILWNHPDVARGKFFRLRGRLVEIRAERVLTNNPKIPKTIYWGVLMEDVTHRAVHFFLLDKPTRADGSRFETEEKTYVVNGREQRIKLVKDARAEIQGVFLNLYTYASVRDRNRSDRQLKGMRDLRLGANFMAATFRELPPPPQQDMTMQIIITIAIMCVIVGGLIVFGAVMGRRHSSGSLRIKAARLRIEHRREARSTQWRSIVE